MSKLAQLWGLILLLLLLVMQASAADQEISRPVGFRLKYAPTTSCSLPISSQAKGLALAKEPAFASKQVYQYELDLHQFGSMAMAADKSAKTMYLDLNQNRDLTDDPSGVIRATTSTVYDEYEGALKVTSGPLSFPYRFMGVPLPQYFSAGITSGWQGNLELYGRKWKLSYVDNMDGIPGKDDRLFLEPADEATTYPYSNQGFELTDRVLLDGHLYRWEFAFAPGDQNADLLTTLTEIHAPMGEMRIKGSGIERLVLFDDGTRGSGPQTGRLNPDGKMRPSCVVPLDHPTTSLLLPEGYYERQLILLEGGYCYRGSSSWNSSADLTVRQGKPTEVAMGAPLKLTVSANPNGNLLSISQSLQDASGKAYTLFAEGDKNPPQLEVFWGSWRLVSGSFPFG